MFDEGRTAFIKYTKFGRLAKDSKLVFYVSKEKKLIGEGTIERIEKTNPETAWTRYGGKMFLNETEYTQYVSTSAVGKKNRKMNEITVFILKNLRKFRNPVQCKSGVTPAGCYLSWDEYRRIIVDSNRNGT
jgi:hypothetical protein